MFIGILIIFIGLIALINEMNLGFQIEYDLVWPMLMIIFSVYMMIKNKKFSFWYSIMGFIGAWYVLYYFDIITASLENYFWPVVLIILGFAIIANKASWNKKVSEISSTCATKGKDGRLNFNGVFGGVTERVKNNDFKGCIANAIFGGVELDLRDIKIKDDAIIDANSIFGGVDLVMPEDYNVVVNSFAVFGGNDNKIDRKFDDSKKTIYINCVSIFGGAEIK